MSQLRLHDLDMVLADAPSSPYPKVRGFNHLLGKSEGLVLSVAACDAGALLKVTGLQGPGFFAAPSVIGVKVASQRTGPAKPSPKTLSANVNLLHLTN